MECIILAQGSENPSGGGQQKLLCGISNHIRLRLTHLIAHRSPFQQQAEAVDCLLVVLQALTQPAIVILHQPPVQDHFQLA